MYKATKNNNLVLLEGTFFATNYVDVQGFFTYVLHCFPFLVIGAYEIDLLVIILRQSSKFCVKIYKNCLRP